MRNVTPERRGAAFGAILAAFDSGIGVGSTSMGWIIQHYGFRSAFGVAAAISALALPYFLFAERLLKTRQKPTLSPTSSRLPGIAAVGLPKNGDVITPE